MIERIGNLIDSLENAPMSVAGWIAGFLGIVWIRYFLESFSNRNLSDYLPSDIPILMHFIIFFITAAILTIVIVSATTRIPALPMTRSVIFVLPIMWLAPLIDLVGGGARMSYAFPATQHTLLKEFFTYFGSFSGSGVTLGLCIELGLIILMLGVYVYVKTKRLSKALIGVIAAYTVIFFTGSLPSLIALLLPNGTGMFVALQTSLISRSFIHLSETYSTYRTMEMLFAIVMAQALYVVLCISGVVWLYLARKNVAVAILKNINLNRTVHFFVVAVLGGLIALSEGSRINWTILDLTTIAVVVFTITFAGIFAIITNDLVDKPIDAISNKKRPLVTGALTPEIIKDVALVCGLMSLAGALILGLYALSSILIFSAAYYIYSAPPLRLKRIPILSSMFIGIATLAIMLLGFFVVSTNQEFSAFPASIALLVVLFMAAAANVRDLKDIEGDAAVGICTLPTLLGEHHSRMVIGAMMFIAYALVPLFIPIHILWIPSLIAGVVSLFLLIQGKGERPIFSLYFIYLVTIVILLYFV